MRINNRQPCRRLLWTDLPADFGKCVALTERLILRRSCAWHLCHPSNLVNSFIHLICFPYNYRCKLRLAPMDLCGLTLIRSQQLCEAINLNGRAAGYSTTLSKNARLRPIMRLSVEPMSRIDTAGRSFDFVIVAQVGTPHPDKIKVCSAHLDTVLRRLSTITPRRLLPQFTLQNHKREKLLFVVNHHEYFIK